MTIPNTCGPRDKNFSKQSVRSALGERGGGHNPKDSKPHIKHSGRALDIEGSRAFQTRKHLGQRRAGRSRHLGQVVIGEVTWTVDTVTGCGGDGSTFQPT